MKNTVFIIFLSLAVILASCKPSGNASEKVIKEKQEELAKLQKEHDEISDKIKKLQDELKMGNDKGTMVSVEELKPVVFSHFIEVQARLDADQSVNVFAEGVGGMITQIMVKEGQPVSKGQILAKLDDNLLQQNLKALKANLDYVTTMYNKQKALWDQKIGSEAQYLQIKTQKESLESQVAALNEQINMSYIKAPVAGTVEDVPVKVGQLVGPGIIAFRVVNLSSLKVVADLAESYSSRVNKGDQVLVYFPDLKKEVSGTIDYSSKFINPTNRTFQVGVRLNSFDQSLKANMVAVLKIKDYSAPNSIVVPVNTVQTDQKGTYVAVAEKTTSGAIVKHVPVEKGETYKGLTEIKSGLKSGDLLITAGYLDSENGQKIKF